jgi:hypothetical protein
MDFSGKIVEIFCWQTVIFYGNIVPAVAGLTILQHINCHPSLSTAGCFAFFQCPHFNAGSTNKVRFQSFFKLNSFHSWT